MERPAFTLCICPDTGLIKSHVETLLAQIPTENGKVWEKHTFWGDEDLPPRFWEKLTLQGLFAVPTLVVLRQAQSINAQNWKRLSAIFGSLGSHIWCIVCFEGAWEKGQPKLPAHISKLPFMEYAQKKGWIWRTPGLDARGIKALVQQRAKALQLQFTPDGFDAFCGSVPPDAMAIENALQKLSLATALSADGTITQEMVSTDGYTPEANIFALIRHLQAGNIPAIWREMHRQQQENDNPIFALLALLHREARLLWQIHAGENVRIYPNDLQAKKTCAAALGFSGIAKLLQHLVDADMYIKSGEQSPEQALEALAVTLAILFRPAITPRETT